MKSKFKLKSSAYNVRDPKKLKLLNHYHGLDKKTRGAYLIQANWAENYVAGAIASHFAPLDRGRRLMLESIILRDVDFHSKIRILERILKRYYSEIPRNYSHLIKDLDKIRQTRNRHAHSVIDLRDRYLKLAHRNTLRYEMHSGARRRFETVTKRTLENEESLASDTTSLLSDIESYIREKAATQQNRKATRSS